MSEASEKFRSNLEQMVMRTLGSRAEHPRWTAGNMRQLGDGAAMAILPVSFVDSIQQLDNTMSNYNVFTFMVDYDRIDHAPIS